MGLAFFVFFVLFKHIYNFTTNTLTTVYLVLGFELRPIEHEFPHMTRAPTHYLANV